jgi:hypothetical protein
MDDDKLYVDDLQKDRPNGPLNRGCLRDNMKRAGGEFYSTSNLRPMKLFQLATALALTGSATASSTARPSGKYTYHKDAAASFLLPTDIAVTFHGETLDAHVAGCTGEAINACTSKANFACFDVGFRMDDDKLYVDDLQKDRPNGPLNRGCLRDNMKRAGGEFYSNDHYEMSYNAAEDSIAVLLIGEPGPATSNYTVVLQNTAPRKVASTPTPQSSDFHVRTPKASSLRGSLARGKSTAAQFTIKGQCADGWLCFSGSAVSPGGCEPAPAFELQVVGDATTGLTTLTLPADGHPYEQCLNPKGFCPYNLDGQWVRGNWSDEFLGTVTPGRADGKTTVSIVESHMAAAKNSLVFTTFSGASGMHTQNCTVYF